MEPIAAGGIRFGGRLLRLQSDERLAALAAGGHDEAFEVLVRRYRGALIRACQGLVDGRAEDAVQQGFLNAYQALTRNGPPDRFRPWLYRIALNSALKLQEEGPTALFESNGESVVGASAGADEVHERQEELQDTVRAIRALPSRQRRALLLREMEGRSHQEIATALGLTGGAARQLIYRARETVRSGVTAITPPALLVRMLGASGEAGQRLAEIAGATGGGLAAKAAVTALVAGGIAGGVALGPLEDRGSKGTDSQGVVESVEAADPPGGHALNVRVVSGPSAAHGDSPGAGGDDRSAAGDDRSGLEGDEDSSGPGSSDDEGDGELDSSGPGSSGSGDDGDGELDSSGPGSSGSGDDGDDELDSSGTGSSVSGSFESDSGSSGSGSSGPGSSGGGADSPDSDSSVSGSSGSDSGSSGSGSSG